MSAFMKLHISHIITGVIWTGHSWRKRECLYRPMKKPMEKRPLGMHSRRWEA